MTLTLTANETAARLGWWDITGGIVMPLFCAAAQVVLLQGDTVGPWLAWGYAVFGIIAVLASARSTMSPSARSFVCGANFGCAIGWLLTAFDHFLLSYYFAWLFAVIMISLPSIAAAQVNARRALQLLRQDVGLRWRHAAVGVIATLLPPAAAQFAEARWLTTVDQQLWAHDTGTVAAGLRSLDRYPLRMGRFDADVCEWVVIDRTDLWDSDDDLAAELRQMLGPDFWHCDPRDPHG